MKMFYRHSCLLKILALLFLITLMIRDYKWLPIEEISTSDDFEVFMTDWCRFRQPRTDLQTVLGPCIDKLKWHWKNNDDPTNATKSYISSWQLKPAGQFSRFFIQAISQDGRIKMAGGDWWRINIKGAASMKPAVFDLYNGTYEVLFLIVEPGIYNIHIFLDYTSCNGFRDPPDDWFIIGNSQGKMQPLGTLKGRAKDFLLEPFEGGKEIMINIRLPNGRGLNMFNILPVKVVKKTLDCGIKCNFIWDGYGRWIQERWKPYLKVKRYEWRTKDTEVKQVPLYNTLWIYGDSQARRMFLEVINTTLCRSVFKSCQLSMNWVYEYSTETPHQDDLDFDYTKVKKDIKKVLKRPEMSENSIMVLNLGLHYAHSTNFSNYVKLLNSVVNLFKGSDGKSVRMIWKTSTPLSREKDLEKFVQSDRKRFLNNPRVAMFNAFATSLMCTEGFEILDIHPLTSSYPHGTGGPNIEFYKEHDIVHFKPHVMAPFEETLTQYLKGDFPKKISFDNYMLS